MNELPDDSSADPLPGPATDEVETFDRTRPHRGSEEADHFLRAVVKLGASDLHLKSGQPPCVRIRGELRKIDREPPPNEEFEARILAFLTEEERGRLLETGSVDFAYDLEGGARFRFNVYRQESGISVAARVVPRDIPSIDTLHLPPIVTTLAESRHGLVLVSGPTGSGKSTTLAAMLEHINGTRNSHVVTIEDPIEFLFTGNKCLINQREIGINVKDFPTALRALMREDPDVVLIGEMRDAASFRAALRAADTGHLVLSSIHAAGAAQTIERVLNLFAESEARAIRQSLAFNLRGIVSQKLVRSSVEAARRVPAVDVLIATPFVRKLITDGNDIQLNEAIRTGDEGMVGFVESLYQLHQQELIDAETGTSAAPNAEEFRRLLMGIRRH